MSELPPQTPSPPINPASPVLTGLSVLRLGHSRAGNYLQRILRDYGATILRMEDVRGATHIDRPGLVVVNDLGRDAKPPSGFDYASLAQRDPTLVYCSLVSFPDGGPTGCAELEDGPILAALGLNRYASDVPRREPLPAPSFFGAVTAAIYLACALRPHIRSAGPQKIEVSLFAATLNVLGRALATVADPRFPDAARGIPKLPVAELYRCADGRYLQPHATYPHFVHILCKVGGHPEWAREAGQGLRRLKDKATEDLWRSRFSDMYRQKTALEWENLIEGAKGSATVCRSYAEWRDEQHARHAQIFVPDEAHGGLKIGPATMISANEARQERKIPAPPRTVATGPTGKPLPLSGLRVVDFCIVIAGPTVARILADLGADVIKVDAPNRELSPYLWLDVNRGKRSIVLDLRKAEAREIAAKLIERADIVTENFRHGKFADLGFSHDKLAAERPDLIFGSTNALDYEGAWAKRPGWEHNAQAGSGQQVARQENGVPQQVPFPVNDYATGMLGALGIVLAILRRDLTGVGSRVRGSLVRSGTLLQLISFEPEVDAPAALNSPETLRCSDGWTSVWLSVDATAQQQMALSEARAVAKDLSAATIAERLRTAGLTALVESKPSELLQQPWMFERRLAIRWEHPVFGQMQQLTPHAEASAFETRSGFPAPEPGAQTIEILKELGYSGKIESFLADATATAHMKLFSAAD